MVKSAAYIPEIRYTPVLCIFVITQGYRKYTLNRFAYEFSSFFAVNGIY